MKNEIADGWHNIAGYRVYTEDGKILRGVEDGLTVYPYRKEYAMQYDEYSQRTRRWTGAYNECCGISVDAFRKGVNAGNITMQ